MDLRQGLAAGDYSARELVSGLLVRIDEVGGALNAFITLTGDEALAAADAADQARAAGNAGPLAGLPIVHKDLFCTAGVLTTCASRILDNFVSPYDATVVARLREAGAVMLGKTNMDEFAMGSSATKPATMARSSNPWDTDRRSRPAVPQAARPRRSRRAWRQLATGTDTGGSVRQPAALCGITVG